MREHEGDFVAASLFSNPRDSSIHMYSGIPSENSLVSPNRCFALDSFLIHIVN